MPTYSPSGLKYRPPPRSRKAALRATLRAAERKLEREVLPPTYAAHLAFTVRNCRAALGEVS